MIIVVLSLILTGCVHRFKVSDTTLSVEYNQDEIIKLISEDLNVPPDELENFKIKHNRGHHKGHTKASFKHHGTVYDYEIGNNGKISQCKKYRLKSNALTAPQSAITEEEALNIALDHAGLNKESIRFIKIKLDRSYTHSEYEIEFRSGMVEYEYEIAMDGSIISFEKEHQ